MNPLGGLFDGNLGGTGGTALVGLVFGLLVGLVLGWLLATIGTHRQRAAYEQGVRTADLLLVVETS